MPMNAGDIERLIKEGLPDAQVRIEDPVSYTHLTLPTSDLV